LKQGLNSPMSVEEQVVVIFAGTNGYVDDIPVADVKRFENDLLSFIRGRHPEILDHIRTTREVPAGDALDKAVTAFKDEFVSSETAGGPEPDAQAQADANVIDAGGRAEATLPEDQLVREDD
jgi:F-type H+-transporting ATPase subunit alpha